ncbi:MAG: RNA methyltransferase [Planctomycetota bacterium]
MTDVVGPEDSRVAVYADLRHQSAQENGTHFICEGRWVVQRLIASDLEVESLLVQRGLEQEFAVPLEKRFPIYVMPKTDISKLVGFDFHRGVLGCGIRPRRRQIDEFDTTKLDDKIVLLDRVNEPENVGTILRSCAAFGVRQVVLGPQTVDPFRRRVVRVSMATVLKQDFIHASCYDSLCAWLAGYQGRIVATTLASDSLSIQDLPPTQEPTVLMVGNEGDGIDPRLRSIATQRVKIPMDLETDSLNVSAAAAIFLFRLFG